MRREWLSLLAAVRAATAVEYRRDLEKYVLPRVGHVRMGALDARKIRRCAEGATIFSELIDSGRVDLLVDKRQAAGLKAGGEIRARDYLQAQRLRTILIERFRALFETVDVIVGLGRTSTAPAIDAPLDGRPPGAGSLTSTPTAGAPGPGNTGLIPAGNLAGLPAIFFPCGFGTDGLPVGLQLVGPPWSEPLLVAIVSAYQRETGHHLRRPKDRVADRAISE